MEEKKKKRSLVYILSGGILEEDFVMRHTKMIVLVVFLFFLYISNRYDCMIKLREIDKLQHQLQEIKYEYLSVSAQLTGQTRPSQIENLVKQQGLSLEKATTPPYKIK